MITSRLDNTQINITLPLINKYGFLLSGGLDSAVLLYLLLTNNPGINIQIFSIMKTDGSHKCLTDIIEFMRLKTGVNLTPPIFVGDPTAHHDIQGRTAIVEIEEKYDIDFIIFGSNSNPPESVSLPGVYPRRARGNHPKVLVPFKPLFKTHIVDLVFEYRLEDLLDITHTCTEYTDSRCNMCFQCSERAWAFKELNRIDTGEK